MSAQERFKLVPAVHLFLVRNEKILLARRSNTGWMDGYYSVVAGHIDGDETATRAMAREAKEEAGIDLDPQGLAFVHVMHRHTLDGKENERVDFFFTADRWEGEPKIAEPDKCDDLTWFPLRALPVKMVPYVRAAIEAYKNKQAYSEFEWSSNQT